MKLRLIAKLWLTIGVTGSVAAGVFGLSATYAAAEAAVSGQTHFGQVTVEPAIDDVTGDQVFLMTPDKAPFPSKANPAAQEELYLVAYPTSSTLAASGFNCQPTNCDHLNVLPFPNPTYDSNSGDLAGTSKACVDYNSGNPCTVYKGHDHLVGIASTGGEFNVAWKVILVLFTKTGVDDGAMNTRVTTLNQINGLIASGDAVLAPTPIVFNCQAVSETTYLRGTPLSFVFP
jgi:hypothetical protein